MTTLLNEEEQAILEAASTDKAARNQRANGGFRKPNSRITTPGFPHVEAGIFVADEKSKNAGDVYFDIRRVGANGERFKLLRLKSDFFGSLLAHAMIAEKRSEDPTITETEQQQYAEIASDVANAVIRQALSHEARKAGANGKSASPFAGSR
ncbi:MAG: hypothetical protein CMJ58_25610 [Planctomycetaceae bacterium]|nr:hypothetical protein [Planctomycetaceae bacterium]